MTEWIIFRCAMGCLHMAKFFTSFGILGRDFFIWLGDTISKPYRGKK